MTCKFCGALLPEGTLYCTSCGGVQEESNDNGVQKNKTSIPILIMCIALFIFNIGVGAVGVNAWGKEIKSLMTSAIKKSDGDNLKPHGPSAGTEPATKDDGKENDGTDDTEPADAEPTTGDGIKLEQGKVSADLKAKLDAVDTDYNKINWLKEFTLEDYPNIVVSVAPFSANGEEECVIAITNLTDEAVSISVSGDCLDGKGNTTGKFYTFESCVSSGCSAVTYSYGGDSSEAPTGDIAWSDVAIEKSDYYVPATWSCEYKITPNKGSSFSTVKYKFTNEMDAASISPVGITVFALDKDGNIISCGLDSLDDAIEPCGSKEFESELYVEEDKWPDVKGSAVFSNPYYEVLSDN